MGKRKYGIFSNLIWSLTELCRFKKMYIGVFLVESIFNGVYPIISLILIQQITDILQYKREGIKEIVIKLLIMILFQLFCELILNMTQMLIENMELEFEAYFQEKILKKVAVLDSKDFENTQTYNLINRTQYDGNAGILGTIKILFSLGTVVIRTISYIVIIMKYNFLIFGIIVLLPIIRYFFEKKYNLEDYKLNIKNTEEDRKLSYLSFLLTNSENFKEIKSYNLFEYFINKYRKIKKKYNGDFISLHKKRTKTYSIIGILEKIVEGCVMMLILFQTFIGTISIGNFILYNNSIDSLKENIMTMFSQVSLIYKNSAMIKQIRKFFSIVPEDTRLDGIEIEEIKKIELINVSYRYKDKQEYTLKDINLKFVKGDFIILLGCNGSGKSTLIKIIMGIYNDYEGDIYVNNMNLRSLNLEIYRKKVSVMFQSYIKYESSVMDNIKYGNFNISELEINNMLSKVALAELTDCIERPLGFQFTEGTQISIGQWQKLALGRSLAKHADMHIFDEPNASLDIASENIVLNMLYDEMKDKITILIIHRFNCILERANKIIVLKDGMIREMGIHNELINNHDIYYQLYMTQKEMTISNKED